MTFIIVAVVSLLVGIIWALSWSLVQKKRAQLIETATEKAFEQSMQKAKETLNAADDDISRRINELRERGRAGK